jgi:hypothetical protein
MSTRTALILWIATVTTTIGGAALLGGCAAEEPIIHDDGRIENAEALRGMTPEQRRLYMLPASIDTKTGKLVGRSGRWDVPAASRATAVPRADIETRAHALTATMQNALLKRSSWRGFAENYPTSNWPPSGCPAPSGLAGPKARELFEMYNQVRVHGFGLGCAFWHESMFRASDAHARYTARWSGTRDRCDPDNLPDSAHSEVFGCPVFTGEFPWNRIDAAGGFGGVTFAGEVLSHAKDGNEGHNRKNFWDLIDVPFHRAVIINPEKVYFGGSYAEHDFCVTAICQKHSSTVMNFGRIPGAANHTIMRWPYQGQVNVPMEFDGVEWPQPPAPPQGFPAGYPVSVRAKGFHGVRVFLEDYGFWGDGPKGGVPVIWLQGRPEDDGYEVMYSEQPLKPGNWYIAHMEGYIGNDPAGGEVGHPNFRFHRWSFRAGWSKDWAKP